MKVHPRGIILAVVASGSLLASHALAQNETHSYGVANFGGDGECGSSGQTHEVHTSTSRAFDDVFDILQSLGLWDSSLMRDNQLCRGSYWEDASKSPTADDNRSGYGVDEADVIYIHTHGGRSTANPPRTWLTMGHDGHDCSAHTNADMLFDSDLDIAVIKACQSGDYDVWRAGGYRQQFSTPDSQLRMWNAFHGDSSCGKHVTGYVGRYASNSIFAGVGENWIDEAYDRDIGSNNDDCPVSIVLGSNASNRAMMFEWGGWRDRKETGSRTGSTIYFVGGCDPSNGTTLPD